MITRQQLDKKTRITLMALKSYQTRTLLTVLQRQYNERLTLENKFLKDFRKLVRQYEEKVITTYTSQTEKGVPNYNITPLLGVANQDFKEKYQKLLYKHLLLVEKNAHNQTDELIKLQKRKRLGQKQEQISFKELPLTWLSMKAKDIQTLLEPVRKKPYVVRENKPVKQYLRNHTLTVSQKTADRIDKNIQQILTKSETEGTNSRGVAKHITKKFKDLRTWEAERIARTEINAANNLVSHQRLLESGLVDYKQWITAQDHRVRGLRKKDKANHVIMNGEIARIGEPFSNGLQYPGDYNGRPEEFINCRCTLVPYIPDYDMIAPNNMTTWHEEDMQRLPTNTGQQITLQLQENMKLYQVREGYMKLYHDKVSVKPKSLQTTLSNSLFTKAKNTLDDILKPLEKTHPTNPKVADLKIDKFDAVLTVPMNEKLSQKELQDLFQKNNKEFYNQMQKEGLKLNKHYTFIEDNGKIIIRWNSDKSNKIKYKIDEFFEKIAPTEKLYHNTNKILLEKNPKYIEETLNAYTLYGDRNINELYGIIFELNEVYHNKTVYIKNNSLPQWEKEITELRTLIKYHVNYLKNIHQITVEHLASFSNAFNNDCCKIPSDIVLYKGVSNWIGDIPQVGYKSFFKNYNSTSHSEKIAKRFKEKNPNALNEKKVLIEYHVNKNILGIPIMSRGKTPDESEFLLKFGQKYEVTAVKQIDDGSWHIICNVYR